MLALAFYNDISDRIMSDVDFAGRLTFGFSLAAIAFWAAVPYRIVALTSPNEQRTTSRRHLRVVR